MIVSIGGQVLRWMQSDNPRHTRDCSMALQNASASSNRMLSGEVANMATGPSRSTPSLRRPSSDGLGRSRLNRGHPATVTLDDASPASSELRSVELSPTEDVIGKDRREAEGITFNDAMDQRQRGDPELPRSQHEAGPERVAIVLGEDHRRSVSLQEPQATKDPLAGDHELEGQELERPFREGVPCAGVPDGAFPRWPASLVLPPPGRRVEVHDLPVREVRDAGRHQLRHSVMPVQDSALPGPEPLEDRQQQAVISVAGDAPGHEDAPRGEGGSRAPVDLGRDPMPVIQQAPQPLRPPSPVPESVDEGRDEAVIECRAQRDPEEVGVRQGGLHLAEGRTRERGGPSAILSLQRCGRRSPESCSWMRLSIGDNDGAGVRAGRGRIPEFRTGLDLRAPIRRGAAQSSRSTV